MDRHLQVIWETIIILNLIIDTQLVRGGNLSKIGIQWEEINRLLIKVLIVMCLILEIVI